jgi:hypothetical protein
VNDFAIQINSKHEADARLSIFSSTGVSIERFERLECNTRHHIGQAWPTGLYVVKVEVEGKILSKKIIKK